MPNDPNLKTLDTGDPGFSLDGNTATYDVGNPQGEGITPAPRNKQVDVTDAFYNDGRHKDLSKTTRTLLGQYLGRVTEGKEGSAGRANDFPVDSNSAVDVSIGADKNFPAVPGPSSNSSQYAPGDQPGLKTTSQAYASIGALIKKGASPADVPNGNELLKGINVTQSGIISKENKQGRAASTYTSALLTRNRFQPDAPRGLAGDYTYQITTGTETSNVSPSVLSQVGSGLSLRSSLEKGSANAGLQPSSDSQVARSALPSGYQFGTTQKFSSVYMEARDVLTALSAEQPTNYVSIGGGQAGEELESWGNMNNVNDPFDGFDSLGMSLLSILLILAVGLSITILGGVLSLVGAGGNGKMQHFDPATGLYPLGRSRIESQNNQIPSLGGITPAIDLGLYRTQNDYFGCVTKGLIAFFSLGDTSLLGLAAKAAVAVVARINPFDTSNPRGFDVVVCRAIIRSAAQIIESFKKIGSSTGVFSGINNILKALGTLRSSKLFSAMNIFAKIGDDISTHYENVSQLGFDGVARTVNGVANDAPQSPVLNSRLKNIDGSVRSTLSWGTARSRAMYLLPDALAVNVIADSKFGDFGINAEGNIGLSKTVLGNSRLSADDVKLIEGQLDGEYVPFYFHDLRTNEIVSFHSFLTSLTDSYTAAYDTVEGFGRVEPARIYKSTVRKFAFSFYIVATSEDDFSEMYRRINKLTTLIYPQYTRGKEVYVDEKNNFIQPFSQLVGASPLIRVRLGDIARSNYTKFALARLFGLGSSLTVNGESTSPTSGDANKIRNVLSNFDLNSESVKKLTLLNKIGTVYLLKENYILDVGYNREKTAQFKKLLTLTLKSLGSSDTTKTFKYGVIKPTDVSQEYYNAVTQNGALVKDAQQFVQGIEDMLLNNVYQVNFDALDANTKPNLEEYLRTNDVKGTLTSQNITDFFSSENNALVKYFEAAGGKGLAGHVESLDFKWMETSSFPTWNVNVGSSAPNMCQVTMNFAPVHDIAPGLDHLGYNRAPIYPVGNFSRQRK